MMAVIALLMLGTAAPVSAAAVSPAPPDPNQASTVLDNNSLWRCLKAFKYTDVRTADGKLVTRSINAYWGGIIGDPST